MSSKASRRVLTGLEATPGTYQAVDTALHCIEAAFGPKVDIVFPEEDLGTYAKPRSYIGASHGEGALKFDALYDELPYPLAMALGNVSPVGGAPPYAWTWPLPNATATAFATFVLELTDGGSWVVRGKDVFAKDLTISMVEKKAWQVAVSLLGGETDYPAGISGNPMPGTENPVRFADTKLYMDALYANVGDTEWTDAFLAAEWKITDLQHQKAFGGSEWPTGRGNARYSVSLKLTLECDTAKTRTLRDLLLTQGTIAIRLQADDGTYTATIDGSYVVTNVPPLNDKAGNNTVVIEMELLRDSSGNTGEIVVESPLAAL